MEILANIRQILSRKQKFQFLLISLLITIQAIFETVAVFLVFPFMYVMMGTEDTGNNYWMQSIASIFKCRDDKDLMVVLSVILIFIYIFKNVFGVFVKWVQSKWMSELHYNVMVHIYQSFLNRKYAYYLTSDAAEMARAVFNDVSGLYELIKAFFNLFQKGAFSIMLLITLLVINPLFVAVGGGALLLCLYVLNKIISKRITYYGELGNNVAKDIINLVNQTVGIIKNILINRKQKFFVNKMKKYVKGLYNSRCSYEVVSDMPGKLVESIAMTGIFLYVIILLKADIDLVSMMSEFAVFALAVVKILPSVVHLNSDFNKIKYYASPLRHIVENLSYLNNLKTDVEQKNDMGDFQKSIILDNVYFGYEDSEKLLYNALTFKIINGSSVAFIGTTGSGKTTLVDIILGLHEPTRGGVYVDGSDIFENRDAWGKQIGYIPQNIYLCDTSIESNVAFGEEEIDREQVIKCLKDAKIWEFVESLPEGLETEIGENGVRLSGGQRQRIGIARALYNNPKFLVMDEATSALDADTEEAITDSIKNLSHKTTILIIAHRIKTILDCDYIYRVENGKVELVEDKDALKS